MKKRPRLDVKAGWTAAIPVMQKSQLIPTKKRVLVFLEPTQQVKALT